MQSFYLICPIGLEDLVIYELEIKKLLGNFEKVEPDKGGVMIECRMEVGLALNALLKTPTRILLRLTKRKCRDFPKLYQIVSKYQWNRYLDQEQVEWNISARKSRIINTKKAQQTCEEALKKYLLGSPLKRSALADNREKEKQKVYVRIVNDEIEISIDTSGRALYIREDHKARGKASLRENYAACLLLSLKRFLAQNNKESSQIQLIDPMCSTGVFLRESNHFYRPHLRENFPFKRWRLFAGDTQGRYNDMVFQYCQSHQGAKLFADTIGLDITPATQSSKELKIFQQDLFEDLSLQAKQELAPKDRVVALNPPYGKRIAIHGDKRDYYQKVQQAIMQNYRPCAVAMLIPAQVPFFGHNETSFNNNGIKVRFNLHKFSQ